MYATRSQTEETAKLEYTAYNAQQTQHSGYLTESDFGGHAKEETTLFSVTSQPPPQPLNQSQSSQQPTTPHEQQQQPQQQQQQQPHDQQQQQVEQVEQQDSPTLADYNQSTSKGHEILSQVSFRYENTTLGHKSFGTSTKGVPIFKITSVISKIWFGCCLNDV